MNLKSCIKLRSIRLSTQNFIMANSYSTKTKPKFRPKSNTTSTLEANDNKSKYNKKLTASTHKLDLVNGEILYGIYPVLMALKSGKRNVNEIFYNENTGRVRKIIDLAHARKVKTTSSNPHQLQMLAQNSTIEKNVTQGVCAYVHKVNCISVQ